MKLAHQEGVQDLTLTTMLQSITCLTLNVLHLESAKCQKKRKVHKMNLH
ncbi:hypothetical protein NSU02_09990 [Aeribacillus sp. FSL W8-0870]